MPILTEEKVDVSAVDTTETPLITEEQVADLQRVELSCGAYCFFKRTVDVIVSGLALLVLLVPMAIIALLIRIFDPGKVFFTQKRVGKDGKLFTIYKFRTMRMNTPKYMATSDVDKPETYLTPLGQTLRKWSLDELPQLFNVLKGDMSLVGPRPLIPNEKEIHQMRDRFGVYAIRPGVTGLAQINGRDTISPAEKVRWDVCYLEHFGPALDLKILFATVPKVFGREGVVEGYGSHGEYQRSKTEAPDKK
ncbi:MAG: sugar transferase [Oscillospiraceae bacterium]|nr:sugar transferase [Oscillospiraceae bacterium]